MAASAQPWRLLAPIEAEGSWQMAIDRWLLQRAVAGDPQPVLRFYRWSRPTLSLGRHQGKMPARWRALVAAGTIAMVQRPSGGGAVLHGGDLTYALVWPQAPAARRQAYNAASLWLVEGFSRLGINLAFGAAPATAGSSDCFGSSTAADLVETGAGKRVGSAQLWRQGCLLQHGSLLLEPPCGLWQDIFGAPPPRLAPLPEAVRHWRDLAAHLVATAATSLPGNGGGPLEPMRLSAADWRAIREQRQGQ